MTKRPIHRGGLEMANETVQDSEEDVGILFGDSGGDAESVSEYI